MEGVKLIVLFVAVLSLVSCVGSRDALVVKQFTLRDQLHVTGEEPMIRMEKERRLRGAVSTEERKQRLGQYYTLLWSENKMVGMPVEAIFEYRQGKSGSKIKTMKKTFPPGETSGKVEFSVVGDGYFEDGKVTSWRATAKRGDVVIGQKRSYLWQ